MPMSAEAPSGGMDGVPGTPIAEAARLLGVPMPTLRSWELRYGIPQTSRAPGKHRRYYAPELHALKLMRDEIARGKRASVAAQSVRSLLGLSGPAAGFIDELLAASERFDAESVQAVLDRAISALGLGSCIDDVLFPSLRQVGIWWQTGCADIDQERLTSETVRTWLDGLAVAAPAARRAEPVILACGPSDQHTIALEALGVLLRYTHRATRILGARTPVQTLVSATVASRAPAVVVVSHLSAGRQAAIRSLRAVHGMRTRVFYAGNAFTSERSRRGVPGTYLGTRVQDACTLVDAAVAC
jgi:MerR family transcriptional regulator, light-induced transcriptional regulator